MLPYCVTVYKVNCWKTPQNAGNRLSELQEIQNIFRISERVGHNFSTPI
jgi:hypothetical protein